MEDRIPTPGLEGRVKITREDGTSFLAFLEMADSPLNPGTPISKYTLMKDSTAEMFGFGFDAVPDDVLVAIKTLLDEQAEAIEKGVKIAAGSYVGTGAIGSANPCQLNLNFVPKVVIVFTAYANECYGLQFNDRYWTSSFLWTFGQTITNVDSSSTNGYVYFSLSGSTLRWYNNDNATHQLNESGVTYKYVAIGKGETT